MTPKNDTALRYIYRVLDRSLALRLIMEQVVPTDQTQPLIDAFDEAIDDLWALSPDVVGDEIVGHVLDLCLQDYGQSTPWVTDLLDRIEIMDRCDRRRQIRKVRSFVEDTLMPLMKSSSLADLANQLGVQPRTVKHYHRHGFVKADAARAILEGIKGDVRCESLRLIDLPMIPLRYRIRDRRSASDPRGRNVEECRSQDREESVSAN